MLSSFYAILEAAKSASDILQSPNVDLAKAMYVVETLKDRMTEFRSGEDSFGSIWQRVIDNTNDSNLIVLDASSTGRRIRCQRNVPARLQDSVLIEPLVQERAGATKDTFKTEIFYPVLSKLILE